MDITEKLEQIISNLSMPNNDIIEQATAELKNVMKYPEVIPALCHLVVSGKTPQIRQYSAVLLRKRLGKLRNWNLLPQEQQLMIKQGILGALINEPEKIVRNSIAHLVGVLVRHESEKDNSWMRELLDFIYKQCTSPDPAINELGSSIFATLTDTAPDQFLEYMDGICEMFNAVLMVQDAQNTLTSATVLNLLNAMAYLVPFALGLHGAEHAYMNAIPTIIKAIKIFAITPDKEDDFVRAFDILDCMADYTPKLLNPHFSMIMEFCLETAKNPQMPNAIRVKAVVFISLMVRLKKKSIVKQKMLEPIIAVIFSLMATEPEGDDDSEEYFLGTDNSSPMTAATQTMDLLALNIPPEKLIPPLVRLLEPALQDHDPLPRRAAYLSMAVIAEGCSEAICHKYLETMLKIIRDGIVDRVPLVRNAAFFALGQFSEHLQPDISKYAPDILPVLFDFLRRLCEELKSGSSEPRHIDRMFYALETFCENLAEDLVPHLPLLMERLFEALNPNNSVHVRELAMSAVSAAANAAGEHMMPYFQQIISILQMYLVKTDNADIVTLRPHAIDTFAALTRTIGKENFLPLTNETVTFALTLLEEANDPDVRRSLYNLIASLAEVINENMTPIFPKIMDRIHDSILSTEEVVPKFKEDDDSVDAFADTCDENEDYEIDLEHTDDEDDAVACYSVENAFLNEKEEAILAIKEFALHTGIAFTPYYEQCFENIYKVIEHPQEDIRKVAIDALVTIILAMRKRKGELLTYSVGILLPKICQIIQEDEELSVVLAGLEGLIEVLQEIGKEAIPTADLANAIFDCISEVLQGKVACQFEDQCAADDDEAQESEYDEAIVEAAGNILPYFGRAMSPDCFAPYFGRALPYLLPKLQKAKKSDELKQQRSFVYGALAECFSALEDCCATFFDALCPILLEGVNDSYAEARQNAVYGLGELILLSEKKAFDAFPTVLNSLSQAVVKEDSGNALDNICGAIARMIISNHTLIPLAQVLPVLLSHLPLRNDFDENLAIFKCFRVLYLQNPDSISDHIEQIIAGAVHVLYKKECSNKDTYNLVVDFLKTLQNTYPGKFENFTNANPEALTFLRTL